MNNTKNQLESHQSEHHPFDFPKDRYPSRKSRRFDGPNPHSPQFRIGSGFSPEIFRTSLIRSVSGFRRKRMATALFQGVRIKTSLCLSKSFSPLLRSPSRATQSGYLQGPGLGFFSAGFEPTVRGEIRNKRKFFLRIT